MNFSCCRTAGIQLPGSILKEPSLRPGSINQAMSDANMRIKSVTNINEITPNFVNQIYYNKKYIYPPKNINIDYWNSN